MKEFVDYVRGDFKYGADLAYELENLETFDLDTIKPKAPAVDDSGRIVDLVERGLFDLDLKSYANRRNTLASNRAKAYTRFKGQCTPLLWTKVEALEGFRAMDQIGDVVALITKVKAITYKFEGRKQRYLSLFNLKRGLCAFTQQRGVTLNEYYKKFIQRVEVLRSYGGAMGGDRESVAEELKKIPATFHSATPD